MAEEIYSTQAPSFNLDLNDSSGLSARLMTHNCQLVTIWAGSKGHDWERPASCYRGRQ